MISFLSQAIPYLCAASLLSPWPLCLESPPHLHLADAAILSEFWNCFQPPMIPQAQPCIHIFTFVYSGPFTNLFLPLAHGEEGLHCCCLFFFFLFLNFLSLAQWLVFRRNAIKVCGLEDIILLIKTYRQSYLSKHRSDDNFSLLRNVYSETMRTIFRIKHTTGSPLPRRARENLAREVFNPGDLGQCSQRENRNREVKKQSPS